MEREKRGRGRPPTIDRERIIEAALDVGFDNLSMKRVADRLGVHPSALYYHFSDRAELEQSVAAAVIDLTIDDRWMPADDASWQDWVRALATEFRRLLLAPGPFALGGFRFRPDLAPRQLEQFDRFFARLFDAGFDEELAALATTFVSQVVFSAATRRGAGSPGRWSASAGPGARARHRAAARR